MRKKIGLFTLLLLCLMFAFGCSHTLEVKNLQAFAVPISIEEPEKKINLAINSFDGNSDKTWYYNAIIENLSSRREFGKFKTSYVQGRGDFKPDYIISIDPDATYESSLWNFLVSCPGSFIFTPAWNGYIYYANINTKIYIYDSEGREIKQLTIDTSYSIRHADFKRTFWPIFSWSILTPLGGTYSAFVYDSDITPALRDAIKTNYTHYMVEKISKELIGL